MEKQYKIIKPAHGYFKGECKEQDYSPTIDTGIGEWHILIGEVMEKIKCKQIGQIVGSGFTEMTGRIYSTDGLTPTIRTFGGGNTEVKIAEPMVWDGFNQQVRADSTVCGTITRNVGADLKRNGQGIIEPVAQVDLDGDSLCVDNVNLRIRKLTERECFRLMAVKDKDFEKIAKNQAMSSLYHLAGDSIVTTCLMAIFGEMLDIDYEKKIIELTEALISGQNED